MCYRRFLLQRKTWLCWWSLPCLSQQGSPFLLPLLCSVSQPLPPIVATRQARVLHQNVGVHVGAVQPLFTFPADGCHHHFRLWPHPSDEQPWQSRCDALTYVHLSGWPDHPIVRGAKHRYGCGGIEFCFLTVVMPDSISITCDTPDQCDFCWCPLLPKPAYQVTECKICWFAAEADPGGGGPTGPKSDFGGAKTRFGPPFQNELVTFLFF